MKAGRDAPDTNEEERGPGLADIKADIKPLLTRVHRKVVTGASQVSPQHQ